MPKEKEKKKEEESIIENNYFAAKEAKKTATIALDKAHNWFLELNTNGYINKLEQMWAAYHGAYYTDEGDSHSIVFTGEQGELSAIAINHLRNLAQHMLVMITANRPALQARATNTDYKSLVQTKLANGLLDYYMREKRLEKHLKVAAEYAIVLGSGYIKMEWNSTGGELYDYNEALGISEYEGDIEFTNLSPFDVVFDSTKEDQNHDWVICRSRKNRYDLIAKYPEHEDEIMRLSSVAELQAYHFTLTKMDESDDIPVYEFYHKKTESMPEGRYMLFLSEDIVLLDSPIPYRDLPIYRMSPSDILGTAYGYTSLFDILPIQDAINSLYSTILTNQSTFGVQNIWAPRGVDVSVSQLPGGLNVIEGNSQFGKPEAMNLTSTPKEVFDFLGMLERAAETISGVNSVARGNPEASLKSGTALALVQSMALQFISGLQQSYVQMIEDVGTGLINILRDFASVPRVAMIVGKSNRSEMKEFVGDDLSNINRVIVDVGNPLARTTAGRVQIAEQLLQMKLLKTPEQYFTIINTGQLDVVMENTQSELLNIRSENEKLVGGDEEILAIMTDQHSIHIREHKSVLSDPDLRKNPELVGRTLDHIQKHIDLLRTADPDLLTMIEEQPLSPQGGSPANQPAQGVPQGSLNGEMSQTIQPIAGGPKIKEASLPNMPKPPKPLESLPVTAEELLPES